MFACLYPSVLLGGATLLLLMGLVRYYCMAPITYRSGLVTLYLREQSGIGLRSTWRSWLPAMLRLTTLVLLIIATARPRTSQTCRLVTTDGIAIILALDVSESMICFDDPRVPVSRFVAAQEEAKKFVMRRPHDLFGLVFFGAIAATRCPLTMDHRLVQTLLQTAAIGDLPHNGTALAQAIIMAVQRLKHSKARSNSIVVLTDGEPSADDVPLLGDAIAAAKKAGVKIYTIGIGSVEGGFAYDSHGTMVRVGSMLNRQLLQAIAQQTGGASFEAARQADLAAIYDTIDRLEKSAHQEPMYVDWYEWYWLFALGALIIISIEMGMALWFLFL